MFTERKMIMSEISSYEEKTSYEENTKYAENTKPDRVPRPDQETADKLWLIIVITCSIVLGGSFLTLAVSLFVPSAHLDGREALITTFTASISFLAGLFVTSPVQAKAEKD